MQFLKQSTAITLKIGPFLDETDGKTAETGLTITQAEVRLSKNGGNIAQKNEASSCTHDELGIYGCPINTTDTATLGRLQLFVHESGALPVWHEFMVVPAQAFDSLFGADRLHVDVREKGDNTMALTTQEKADVNAEADTALSGYDPPTKAEMDTAHALLSTAAALTTVDTVVDAIKAITDNLPDSGALNDLATLASRLSAARAGYLDELAAANIPADVDAIKAYLDTEIAAILVDTGTTLPATLATIAGYLDTEIAAIKAVTDLLPDSGALNDLATILADSNELQGDWTNGGRLDLLIDAIKAKTDNQPAGVPKGVQFTLAFFMKLSSDHLTPATGKTVTVQISKDGGAFAGATNAAAEIAAGFYKVVLTAAEMNAATIAFKITEAACDQTSGLITTSA